jgi:uncharacterized protein YozE (UPF0346 family)
MLSWFLNHEAKYFDEMKVLDEIYNGFYFHKVSELALV